MKIEDLLREAGQAGRSEGCDPRVEERLRSAFRKRQRPVWPVLAGAIAAAVALALWIMPRHEEPAVVPAGPPRITEAVPQIDEPVAPVPRRRRMPAKRRLGLQEVQTDFFALDAAALNGVPDGYLMRVQVPRATMASFGLPVNQALDQRVDADLLIGSNGTARAIRFVRYIPGFQ